MGGDKPKQEVVSSEEWARRYDPGIFASPGTMKKKYDYGVTEKKDAQPLIEALRRLGVGEIPDASSMWGIQQGPEFNF